MVDKDLKRFLAKVDKTDECWLWTGYKQPNGYGTFRLGGKMRYAHRVSYEHYVGPIPEGAETDHLCKVRHCVNPDHLDPVTHKVNMHRGDTLAAKHAAKTHCPQGHEYAGDNLYVDTKGSRRCRACDLERYHRRKRPQLISNP